MCIPISHGRRLTVGLWLLLALLAAGCQPVAPPVASASVVQTLSGGADSGFARALQPMEFVFPRDHGAHPDYATEWWYYTGNLVNEQGVPFGYQLTFFRSALTAQAVDRPSDLAANQLYMAHFALTDGAGRRHYSFDRFSRGAAGLAGAQGEPHYQVWLDDWQAREESPGVILLQASAAAQNGPVSLALTLRQTRPPVFHGWAGLSQKGVQPGNANHYYSLVQLETTGTVAAAGRSWSVVGSSWFDHEFGTSALGEDAQGWDWFSLQLDNGAVLMFAQIRAAAGGSQGIFEGTLVDADGTQRSLLPTDFELTVRERWKSPATGIEYPSGWRVRFPALEIDLTIEPLLPDQEMRVTFVYWEGAVTVEGQMGDLLVRGRGYAELTGYGSEAGRYQR